MNSTADFYNILGSQYDDLADDSDHHVEIKDQLQQLLGEMKIENILDAGCGTGNISIKLAQLGFKVIGIDGSEELLQEARRKAHNANLSIDFRLDDIVELNSLPVEKFDVIICRAVLHSVQHADQLRTLFKGFMRVMHPDGLLLIEEPNFHGILKRKDRLVDVRERNSKLYTSFYDFIDANNLVYNIIITNLAENHKTEWLKMDFTPWSADDIGMLLVQCGWLDLEISSDLLRSDFNPAESPNAVFFARRPQARD